MSEGLTGKQFKAELREGRPKMGLFVNSHSPTVAEQLALSKRICVRPMSINLLEKIDFHSNEMVVAKSWVFRVGFPILIPCGNFLANEHARGPRIENASSKRRNATT
jgi:hypothetical protein